MKNNTLFLSCLAVLTVVAFTACEQKPGAADATPSVPVAAAPGPFDFKTALSGKLVRMEKGALKPLDAAALASVDTLALYYSAHWCPPCRAFTPGLVEFYNQTKAKHPGFELVFVSSDQDAAQMLAYMTEDKMPWPAVAYDQIASLPGLESLSAAGIPYLVVLDAQGNQVLGKSAGEDWKSPMEILEALKARLATAPAS